VVTAAQMRPAAEARRHVPGQPKQVLQTWATLMNNTRIECLVYAKMSEQCELLLSNPIKVYTMYYSNYYLLLSSLLFALSLFGSVIV